MIKQILYFGNPAHISKENKQLLIKIKKETGEETHSRPIEDLGVIVLDHYQISITHGAISELMRNNVVIVSCNEQYMPHGMMLPIEGHHIQTQRMRKQIDASEPLKKNLWQQTIICKINNQAALLEKYNPDATMLHAWAKDVKSGDTDNKEGIAAAWYWARLFSEIDCFTRNPKGECPNNFLNYGYAILRSVVARALVSAGLFPSFGIKHHNQYNAYCLADDIMEPYRPYVDAIVKNIVSKYPEEKELNKAVKTELLKIPHIDVKIENETSPLMLATQKTAFSLVKCFAGDHRKLSYPTLL